MNGELLRLKRNGPQAPNVTQNRSQIDSTYCGGIFQTKLTFSQTWGNITLHSKDVFSLPCGRNFFRRAQDISCLEVEPPSLILKLRQCRSQALVSSLPSPGASERETREEDGALERDWNEYKVRSTGGCKDRLSAYFREDDHEVSYFLHHSSNRNITVT